MGQPSFQASNAIIYLTYSAFLCVHPNILAHTRLNILTLSAQDFGPLFCLVRETSVEEGLLGHEPYTEGLDTTHTTRVDLLLVDLKNRPQSEAG